MPTPEELIAPVTNPVGNGLVNNPSVLPAPTPVAPVATYTAANGIAGQSTATGYAPTPYSVPTGGLVQNQVRDIVEQNSPLLQLSENKAMRTINERGLLNSSLGITAGQEAVISTATPIAQADAASIRDAAFKTTDAQNTSSQFGAAAENAASSTNAQLTTSMNTTNANAANSALAANAQAENVRNLSLLDVNSKQALAVLDTQNRQLLQTNANAANMFQEVVKNIAAISVNDTLSKEAKDSAIASQINLLNQGLQTTANIAGTLPASVSELNLSSFFETTTSGASFTPAQRQAEIANLDQQIAAQQTRRDQIAKEGIGVPVLTGPNASERRVPIWQQMTAEADAELKRLTDQRASLQAL